MRRWLGILVVAGMALAATAEAHHDFTLTYLADRTVTIEGELAQLLFRNPHTLVYMIVRDNRGRDVRYAVEWAGPARSEEHTSELQSQSNLVCRLLLEKKKKKK